jgi:biotin carboxylase
VPSWVDAACDEDAVEFGRTTAAPFVVKPSDSSGQRGVTLVTDVSMASTAIAEARGLATDGRVTIEEYVPGRELNTIVVAHDGDCRLLCMSERVTVPPPSFGIAVEHVAPVGLPDAVVADVAGVAIAATRALGVTEGITYPQIIAGPHGARLVEIAARIPGGHMREVGMYLSGIDPVRVAIFQAMGEAFSWADVTTEPAHEAVTVKFLTANDVPNGANVLVGVENLEQARAVPGVRLAYVDLPPGCAIPQLSSSTARFGAVIAVGETREETYERARRAHGMIRLVTTSKPKVDV